MCATFLGVNHSTLKNHLAGGFPCAFPTATSTAVSVYLTPEASGTLDGL